MVLGGRPAPVLESTSRFLDVQVPRGLATKTKHDLLVWNIFGHELIKDAIFVLPAPVPEWFTFSSPLNGIVTPTGTNQKVLVLMVLPADQSLPVGLAEADMHADLQAKLSGPGKCVNGFWSESSYGKTTFVFDVYNHVIDLDDDWYDYYHPATPKQIDASGATYPIAWSGGETLEMSGAGGFSVTVTFAAGSQTLAQVIQTINDAIDAAYTDPGDPPIVADDNGGQLRLESTEEGSSATLSVDGGTALAALGLDAAIMTPGIDHLDKRYDVFIEALEKRTDAMTDANAQAFISQYGGIIVSHAVSGQIAYYRANASSNWTMNVRGGSFEMGNVYITNGYPWQVFAHEIGHTLGFPDLYDEPGPPELVGTELGSWDIMAGGWQDAHPSTWTKAWKSHRPGSTEPGFDDPWLPASHIETLNPPPPATSRTTEVLLLPSSCDWPPINPFAASHPGVPLTQAIRVALEPGHDLYIEARERGPFSNPTLGDAEYDSEIPHEGVIVIDAINDMSTLPVYRANTVLLSPYSNPIDTVGEDHVEILTATNTVTVRCEEVIGSDPTVYRIEVNWGPGSFFDLRIDPWQPPPWESADIWLDTQVDNDWDEYTHSDPALNPGVAGHPVGNGDRSRVGWPSRVYARVWNDGDTEAYDVEVRFSIVLPAGTGPGIFIGSDTIPTIAPGDFGLAMVEWTPRNTNENHVCIQATVVHQPDELNAINNIAQENVTDWYLEGSSPYTPVEFPFQVQNPLPYPAHFRLQARGLEPGYHMDVKPVDFWLDAEEVKLGAARIWLDDWVPYEDVQREEKMQTPMLSLEWQVLYRSEWIALGGVSGQAHAVRRANLDVDIEPMKERDVMLVANGQAKHQPIRGANVTVRVVAPDGEEVLVTHGKTNNWGVAQIELGLPSDFPPEKEYTAEVLLAPATGTGPAEAEVKFHFPH